MSEFFFEILSEEIPARMQKRAEDDVRKLLEQKLSAQQLSFATLETYSTPRRLVAHITGLPAQQNDVSEEKKGPRIDAPQQAIDGFLKSCGLSDISQCEQRDSGKGVFLYHTMNRKGQNTETILPDVIAKIIAGFQWPKSMRWGSGDKRWVRPLQQIMAYYDGKFLSGFASDTFGHRFLSKNKIQPKDFSDYCQQLKVNSVLLSRDDRAERIRSEARTIAVQHSLTLAIDDALLDEIVGLVEWPVVLLGSFEESYLSVPKEVLITTMRVNQKYIPLLRSDGSLAPHFIITSNIEATDGGIKIIAGNERVLRARLSDAKFFYDQDLKTKLDARIDALKNITFHEKIGTMHDKSLRMANIADTIAQEIGANPEAARRASLLAKADLSTGMVGEFPELQGTMGGYYATADGELPIVAVAVCDHYLPLGPASALPIEPVAIAVSLADKIDSLNEFFRIDEKPTGSRDPYALRRAALGVIRIILENNLTIDLSKFFSTDVMHFIFDRLKVALRDQSLRHDVIDSVLADNKSADLQQIVARIKAVQEFSSTDDGKALLAGYKRAINILVIEEKKDKVVYSGDVANELLELPQEKDLYSQLGTTASNIKLDLVQQNYSNAMTHMAHLRSVVDAFFDNVMVNAENKDIRRNRLQLLALLRNTMNQIANFSKIEG